MLCTQEDTCLCKPLTSRRHVADLHVTLKKSRRAQICRVVREVYLRDDISCGLHHCKLCTTLSHFNNDVLSHEHPHLLIITREVALYQLDFLCTEPCVQNCVLPGSVLNHVARQNRFFYSRLRQLCNPPHDSSTPLDHHLTTTSPPRHFYVYPNHISRESYTPRRPGESIDQHGDREIALLSSVYHKHLTLGFGLHENQAKDKVLVLTNSNHTKNFIMAQGVSAMTVLDYVASVRHQYPLAGESLTWIDQDNDPSSDPKGSAPPESKVRYERHLPQHIIHQNIASGHFHKGIIKMDRNSCHCATVRTPLYSTIRILGYKAINRAIDGDLVVVQLCSGNETREHDEFLDDPDLEIPEGDNDPSKLPITSTSSSKNEQDQLDTTLTVYGKVVGIIRRNWKEYSGSLVPLREDQEIRAAAFMKLERIFRPWDRRIPDIIINTRQSLHLNGKTILVAIDVWEVHDRYPRGHWIQVLGDKEDPNVQAQVILHEHDVITREFTDHILRCLPPADYQIPQEEINRRVDLRHLPTCSIDPVGCKDIDDALSCQTLANGHYQVAVHIADVTHFVIPDTPLDHEAALRCTTVYLVERRTDMLPSLLTTNLCSLVAGADRLTFSVLWEISPQGTILSTDFKKSVIRSDKAFTYEEAQTLLDDVHDNSSLRHLLMKLNHLAKFLREERMSHGALELASLEMKFQVDTETHSPNDVDIYRVRDTNKLVEEFMLLANTSVAKFILDKLPTYTILRCHPPPKADALKQLKQVLQHHGFQNFHYSTSAELAQSLNSITKPDDPYFNRVLRVLTTRCMNQALYMCSGNLSDTNGPNLLSTVTHGAASYHANFYHYGLATPLYTHFTSPIRRYADILVHRLLAVALGLTPLPATLDQRSVLTQQCDRMNQKHQNAQWASRSSVDLFTYRYFKIHGSVQVDAIIIAVRKNGIQVQVPRYGVEGIVNLKVQEFQWCEESRCLKFFCQKTQREQTLAAFDHVWLLLRADDTDLRPKTVMEFLYKTPKENYANPMNEPSDWQPLLESTQENPSLLGN